MKLRNAEKDPPRSSSLMRESVRASAHVASRAIHAENFQATEGEGNKGEMKKDSEKDVYNARGGARVWVQCACVEESSR